MYCPLDSGILVRSSLKISSLGFFWIRRQFCHFQWAKLAPGHTQCHSIPWIIMKWFRFHVWKNYITFGSSEKILMGHFFDDIPLRGQYLRILFSHRVSIYLCNTCHFVTFLLILESIRYKIALTLKWNIILENSSIASYWF